MRLQKNALIFRLLEDFDQKDSAIQEQKTLRKFTAREASEFLKLNYSTFRGWLYRFSDQIPNGEIAKNRRRNFTLSEINEIRRIMYENGMLDPQAFPERRNDEPCVTITILNSLAASCTSSVSAHIATNLGFLGYRVLCCDLDPQASLTNMFGVVPEFNADKPTVYEMIRFEKPAPAHKVIQKTYIPTVDLIPASLNLMKFGYEAILSPGEEVPTGYCHTRISKVLKPILPNYDVVIFNTPPQLNFAVISALLASRGVLIPFEVSAQAVSSLSRYLSMVAKRMELMDACEPDLQGPDFVRLMITLNEKHERSQIQAVHCLQSLLGRSVMSAEFLYSATSHDAGAPMRTVLELEPRNISCRRYERLIESISQITNEIEGELFKLWGRTGTGMDADMLNAYPLVFRSIRGLTSASLVTKNDQPGYCLRM